MARSNLIVYAILAFVVLLAIWLFSGDNKEGILFYQPYDEEESSVDDLGVLSDSLPLDETGYPKHIRFNPEVEDNEGNRWATKIPGPL
jgi:hypothetical protein